MVELICFTLNTAKRMAFLVTTIKNRKCLKTPRAMCLQKNNQILCKKYNYSKCKCYGIISIIMKISGNNFIYTFCECFRVLDFIIFEASNLIRTPINPSCSINSLIRRLNDLTPSVYFYIGHKIVASYLLPYKIRIRRFLLRFVTNI